MSTTQTVRVSLMLPANLHYRLHLLARQNNQNFSQIVREVLDQEVARRESNTLQKMYHGLKALDAAGSPDIVNASTTIDDVLYGNNGAWQGKQQQDTQTPNQKTS